MDDDLRACLAYIVARLAIDRIPTYILDHHRKRFLLMSGTVSSPSVGILDHARGVRITGNAGRLYDHGLGTHVLLNVEGDRFDGFVYGSSTKFSGTTDGALVTIYDDRAAGHYRYTA